MLHGFQKLWNFDDFEAGGPALAKNPLLPPSLKSFLVAHLADASPGATVTSERVSCESFAMRCERVP